MGDPLVYQYFIVSTYFFQYNAGGTAKSNWDAIQRDLHCCGGSGKADGYAKWYGRYNKTGVPDSCCHDERDGCGTDVQGGGLSHEDISEIIYVLGCMEIIEDKLENDVVPMMVVYACVGVLLAIIELICVVLAAAYIAQINRRTSNTSAGLWRYADANIAPPVPSHADETDIVRPSSRINGDYGERSSLRDTVV